MKILITGISGFVAGHFLDFLYNNRIDCEVLGLSRETPALDYARYSDRIIVNHKRLNLIDKTALYSVVSGFYPDYVLHLASFSSVSFSWKNPTDSFKNNSNIFLNLIDVIRAVNPSCRVLSVGSSEEYGDVPKEDLPIRENQPLAPISPYAVARVSQELMSRVYAKAFDMNIIMTRSFNHIGPRQDARFVVPSFIKRIMNVKKSGKTTGVIETGDISIIRDFVDVRDVVRAYWMLLNWGIPGEIYNICSGNALKLSEIIDMIADEIGVNITTKVNVDFVRPNDNKEIVGSAYKLESELGWKCEWDIRETLHDMIVEMSRI